MKNIINRILDFIIRHKWLFIILTIVLIVFFIIITGKSEHEKKDVKKGEKVVEEFKENLPETTSIENPTVKNAKKVSSNNKTDASNETGVKSSSFYNQAKGYQFQIPEGFEAFEGDDGIIYLRRRNSTTQIALICNDGTFSGGISVYEQCSEKIYRMSGLCRDDNGNIVEKTVKNYGTDYKLDKTVAGFNIKYEIGEIWYRNTGEAKNVIAQSCDYYTVMPDTGKGLILVGTSFDESNEKIFEVMDNVLSSLKSYVPEIPALELITYKSSGKDAMTFNYPDGWETGKTEGGLIYFKAPEDSTNAYAGCIIEYFCDYQKDVVDDYAQFSSAMEGDILIPTFTQKVIATDFQYSSNIKTINLNKTIKEKDCIYYEITDTIYPYSNAVKNSMGILKSDITSKRYCFKSSGYDCMINFIGPDTDITKQLFEQILSSIECN